MGYFEDLDNFGNPYRQPGMTGGKDEGLNFTAKNLGTTTDPFSNTLESLKARIRQGAARVEFNFLQTGKGNAQRVTPEMFGEDARRDMRELLKINKMKASTHSPVLSDSLAGFDAQQGGFSDQRRSQALTEIKRAIDFASEASTGGAVVFHVHEWQRPLNEIEDEDAEFTGYNNNFNGDVDESKDQIKYVIDRRTGRPVGESAVRLGDDIIRPQYKTAADMGIVGQRDANGNKLRPDDVVDPQGNRIDNPYDPKNFNRLQPKYDEETGEFKFQKLKWDQIKNQAQKYDIAPEKFYAETEIQRKIEELRGQNYTLKRRYDNALQKKNVLQEVQTLFQQGKTEEAIGRYTDAPLEEAERGRFVESLKRDGPEAAAAFVQQSIRSAEKEQRQLEPVLSSADSQIEQLKETIENMETVEEYGLKKTADTIANAGEYAMDMYNKRKEKYDLEDPLYVAPENWNQNFYGNHPDEYKKVIDKSREKFQKNMVGRGYSENEAQKLANQHIRGTIDIGHLNTFKKHFKRRDNEEIDEYEERYKKWVLKKTEDLVENGYIGHVHLNDNMGYEDEHLTPGQGNAPIKEFMEMLERNDMDDIIVEQGSFNQFANLETMEYVNSPVYGANRRPRFKNVRGGHYGQRSPGLFVAGAYAPSNDFSFWSGTPLE